MDRTELADFLRRCRARLQPAEVGVRELARRRTPGLRREEVAKLAGISPDTYKRLEQRRGRNPSIQVVASVARALRLSEDERDHLYLLAGHEPPLSHRPTTSVRPILPSLLYRLWDYAAMVVSDLGVCLAQNPLSVALMGDLAGAQGWDRSFYWRWFTQPDHRALFLPEDHAHLSRGHVADLRTTLARRSKDRDVQEFVRALRASSQEFAGLWEEHVVGVRRSDRTRFVHPELGLIEVNCEMLLTPEHDQRLLVYSATPGTPSHDRLQLLGIMAGQSPEDQLAVELPEDEGYGVFFCSSARYPQEPVQV